MKFLLLALAVLVAVLLAVQGWFFVQVWWWVDHPPSTTAFMRTRLAELRDTDRKAVLRHTWVAYGRISPYLKRAVVAAEDAKFVDHEGFDWDSIQKALEKNQKQGRVVAGASTISQQLAKNLFLSGSRSWLRKGQEAVITWMLETAMSKRRILEIYLNIAEWGSGVFGAEAAARHHFGISAAALTPEQAAFLAAILPAPRRYDAGRSTPFIAHRTAVLLSRMPGAQIP